jgi:MFS family permease
MNNEQLLIDKMDSQKLWTKDFVLTTLSGLFSAMVFYITMTTLAVYAAKTFVGISASVAGLTASIFVIGSVVGRIFAGRFIDIVGRRKLLLAATISFFLLSLMYLIPVNLATLFILRILHGVTFGIVHNTLATIVIGFIPAKRRGEGIGYFSLNFVIATALGPFIGLFLIRHFGYTALFAGCIISAFIALLFTFLIKIENPVLSNEQFAKIRKKISLHDIFEKSVLPIALIIIIMSMCYTSVTTFIDSYTAEIGLASIASVFFIVYGAFILIVRPLAGKLLDKKGDNIVMIPTIAFFAASLFLLGFANNSILFIIAAILMALGYGNILNIGQAIAVKMIAHHPHRIGTATSTYFVFSDIGMGLGPLLMGLVVTAQGFSAMFIIDGGIIAASILLYYGLHGRLVRKR